MRCSISQVTAIWAFFYKLYTSSMLSSSSYCFKLREAIVLWLLWVKRMRPFSFRTQRCILCLPRFTPLQNNFVNSVHALCSFSLSQIVPYSLFLFLKQTDSVMCADYSVWRLISSSQCLVLRFAVTTIYTLLSFLDCDWKAAAYILLFMILLIDWCCQFFSEEFAKKLLLPFILTNAWRMFPVHAGCFVLVWKNRLFSQSCLPYDPFLFSKHCGFSASVLTFFDSSVVLLCNKLCLLYLCNKHAVHNWPPV